MNSDEMPAQRPLNHDDLLDALVALEALLDRRVTELSDEVAHYPTPIARCDDQLPQLIEQRGEYLKRLRSVRAITRQDETNRVPPTVESIAALVDGYGRPGDGDEQALLSSIETTAGVAR